MSHGSSSHRQMSSGSSTPPSFDNQPKNLDGTPGYYNSEDRSSDRQPNSPGTTTRRANVSEETDQADLVNKTIQFNNQKCLVKGKFRCGDEDLYALESDRSIKGYNGECPKCSRTHATFYDPSKGFYASIHSIHDIIQKQKLDHERVQGRKDVHRLFSVQEDLPPLDQPIVGTDKGIEGDSNSCYMDATLFCMFAYNHVFDTLLHMHVDSQPLQQLQQVLRDNIVHVLRHKDKGFVQRDALYHLRVQLSEATHDPSFVDMEKDPSEFLRAFEHLFHYAPLKTIAPDQQPKTDGSNLTTNIIWEMFDANPQKLPWTNIASIFRNSLAEIPAKLATIPPFLVLVAPRHARSQRSYRYIIPDRQITLDNNTVQLVCLKCNKTNHDRERSRDFYFCSTCYSKYSSTAPPPTTDATVACFCASCLNELHGKLPTTAHDHDAKRIEINKHKLDLFAVLCIETCHYVAFVKCQNRSPLSHEWLFFDSMSDRKYDEKNVSLVARVPDFDRWIEEAEQDKDRFFDQMDERRRQARPTSQKYDEHGLRQLRLFRDGAFFFYENANVNYQ